MPVFLKFLMTALVGIFVVTSASADTYKLKTGDRISISVWQEAELSLALSILPDGKISMPLAGIVEAAGFTIPEVEAKISTALKPYISDPVVNVIVNEPAGNLFYVIGKVKVSGAYPMEQKTNVFQAISRAGGFDRFADTSEIKIFREEGNKINTIPFDYDEAASGGSSDLEIPFLKSGDVIVVP
jgi:polysaccharide export outer membrane protein